MFNNYPISYSKPFFNFGAAVTEHTVAKIKDVINQSAKNLRVRNMAANIVVGCPDKDYFCEADAIYDWIKANTRYLRDIHGTELLFSPLVALDLIESGQPFQGDCDDLTILTLSLLKSIGFPVAVRIAAYNGSQVYQHIYGLINIKGNWVRIEPIKKEASLDWEAPNATKIKDYLII